MYRLIIQKVGVGKPEIKTPKEVSVIVGVHIETVRRWCRNKKDVIKNGWIVYVNN